MDWTGGARIDNLARFFTRLKCAIETIEEWPLTINTRFHGLPPDGQHHLENNLNEVLQLCLPSHLYHLNVIYQIRPPNYPPIGYPNVGYPIHLYFYDGQCFESTWRTSTQSGTKYFSHSYFQTLAHDISDFLCTRTIEHVNTLLRLIIHFFHQGRLRDLHIQISPRTPMEFDPSMMLHFFLYLFPISPTLRHAFIHSILYFHSPIAQVVFNNALNSISFSFIPTGYIYSFYFPFSSVEVKISFHNVTSNSQPVPVIRSS